MAERVTSPATGTLILSQSNNAAAGTNRELFNSHQLMLCHQVLLCAFPILILCISRISLTFIFIAQMLGNRQSGWVTVRLTDIYVQFLKWGIVKRARVYFFTGKRRQRYMFLTLYV